MTAARSCAGSTTGVTLKRPSGTSTRVVRIFPTAARCLRLVRALWAETHEGWLEDHRYVNMEFLKEQKKELRTAA